MNKLNSETVKLITSTQVITSVSSIIKELIENSLDAESTSIDVSVANYGLDRVEVRDNGKGIRRADAPFVGLRYYTSKISSDADLSSLTTLGFRGEALASLCAVAEVTLITRTDDDASGARSYNLDKTGNVTSEKPSHGGRGTTVVATKLYADVPVRKQLYNDARKKKQGLKELESLLTRFALARPSVRWSLKHDKDQLFLKNKCADSLEAAAQIFGVGSLIKNVLTTEIVENDVALTLIATPFGDSNSNNNRKLEPQTFVAINGRPVVMKEIEKIIKRTYSDRGKDAQFKTAFCVVDLKMSAERVDVNLSPNKWDVLLKDAAGVFRVIDAALEAVAKRPEEVEVSSGTIEGASAASKIQDINSIRTPLSPATESNIQPNDYAKLVGAASHNDAPVTPAATASLPGAIVGSSEFLNNSIADESVEGELFHRALTSRKPEVFGTNAGTGAVAELSSKQPNNDSVADTSESLLDETVEFARESPTKLTDGSNANAFRGSLEKNDIRWSKGNLLKSRYDENIEPVLLLAPTEKERCEVEMKENVSKNLREGSNGFPVSVVGAAKDAFPRSSILPLSATAKQPTLFDSFSPRGPPKKPEDRVGFREFEKKMRGEIIKENRGVTFAGVSVLVEDRWRRLDDEQRMNYEAAELLQHRPPKKFHVEAPKSTTSGAPARSNNFPSYRGSAAPSVKRKLDASLASGPLERSFQFGRDGKKRRRNWENVPEKVDLNEYLPSNKKRRRSQSPTPQRVVEVCYDWAKDRLVRKFGREGLNKRLRTNVITVVGQIRTEDHFGWILSERDKDDDHEDGRGFKLFAVSSSGLLERDLYLRMMNDFSLPLRQFPQPDPVPGRVLDCVVTESVTVMDVLLELGRAQKRAAIEQGQQQHQHQSKREVTLEDPRLVKNGFVLRLNRDASAPRGVTVDLLSSSEIATDADFKHVIEAIAAGKGTRSIAETRSLNVAGYLRTESRRMVKNAPAMTHARELKDALRNVFEEMRNEKGSSWNEVECRRGIRLFEEIRIDDDVGTEIVSSKVRIPDT